MGIVEEKDGKQDLIACIETCPEEWSNRLIVTELWVHEKIRRQGIGHALMAIAKEQAVLEHRRAIILETQSCNTARLLFIRRKDLTSSALIHAATPIGIWRGKKCGSIWDIFPGGRR